MSGKGYRDKNRFGIINPYGDIWTPETFTTEKAARDHVTEFWKNNDNAGDLARFKVVPVVVHVTPLNRIDDEA